MHVCLLLDALNVVADAIANVKKLATASTFIEKDEEEEEEAEEEERTKKEEMRKRERQKVRKKRKKNKRKKKKKGKIGDRCRGCSNGGMLRILS